MSTSGRKVKQYTVFYDQSREICYTVVVHNGDIWACGRTVHEPSGYGGNILDCGYKKISDYLELCRHNITKLGYQLTKEKVPAEVIEWADQISQL